MKQVNTIITISVLLFFLLQVISCKKYLDKKSSTGLTTIDRLQDLEALLDNTQTINDRISPLECEAASDNCFSFQPAGGERGQLFYTWQYAIITNIYGNAWQYNYFSVNVANICLEEIQNFPKTADNTVQWNTIKGAALFLRAYSFLDLCWVYTKIYDSVTSITDLGIALRLGTDRHVPTVRATVSQSYDQLISDAKESIAYLPDIASHPLRPSKAAAYGLLARAYLSMRMYDSAFKYADLSLQIRSELMDYNGDADIVRPLNEAASPFRQYNKETIFYVDGDGFFYQMLNEVSIDTALYTSYHANDLRKIAFYMPDSKGYQKFKGNYTQSIDQKFGGIATDEMFLIRAECYARKEMVTEAMNDLNTLMIKRWKNTVPYPVITATDPTEALQKILTERRKELVFRSIRWSDIKRLNKEGAAIVLKRTFAGEPYELLPNSDKYALPIPDDIIRLAGIPQNPGWL